MSKKVVVNAKGISRWYEQRSGKLFSWKKKTIKACDGVSFSLEEGEVLGIIGESGCGKSTLGRVLVQLEPPTAGELSINGSPATELLKSDPKKFRRTVQIVFQNPFDTFPPRHTIGQIMTRALKIHGIGANHEERLDMCSKTLEKGGLSPAEEYLDRYPHELSGGQLQRISILRAMMLNPSFIVADEPVSMLDVSVRAEIINMLLELVREHDTALIFISHDITITRYISNRIAVMYLGRVVEVAESDELIRNPQHPYTQALISNCASIDFDDSTVPIHIEGEPPTPVDPGPGCYFADRCSRATERCRREYPAFIDCGDGHIVSCHCVEQERGGKPV